MKKVLFSLLVVFGILNLTSCATDDNTLEEDDVASLYVGEWSYSDKQLRKDVLTVTIERVSDDEIKILGFHNLGKSIATKFRVFDNSLMISSTVIDGLAIEGEGTSNYGHDELVILYSVDGSDFEANMTKLKD